MLYDVRMLRSGTCRSVKKRYADESRISQITVWPMPSALAARLEGALEAEAARRRLPVS
jgi:hypothetical protein